MPESAPKRRYRVVHGLTYPDSPAEAAKAQRGLLHKTTHAEPGEIVDGIPAASVPWLLHGGHIEEVE